VVDLRDETDRGAETQHTEHGQRLAKQRVAAAAREPAACGMDRGPQPEDQPELHGLAQFFPVVADQVQDAGRDQHGAQRGDDRDEARAVVPGREREAQPAFGFRALVGRQHEVALQGLEGLDDRLPHRGAPRPRTVAAARAIASPRLDSRAGGDTMRVRHQPP